MEKKNNLSLRYWLLCAAAAAVYALLALSDNIWADEAYTFAMLRHSFPEIWRITAADVHPPLYYFLAKLVAMPFGYSQYAVRLFSAACCLLIIVVGGWEITRLFDRKMGNIFMVLFLLYPFALDRAVEARMYSLAALEVFLNALFAYRAWNSNRAGDWIGFVASGVCAAYTHYFALVSVGIVYGLLLLCALLRKRSLLKSWLIVTLVSIVLYLPWMRSLIGQLTYKANNEYWIAPITPVTLVDYLLDILHAGGNVGMPLFFGLLGLWLLLCLCWRRQGLPLLAGLVCVLTVAVGVGASLLLRPVFIIRYLVPCSPLLIFFLAWGLSGIRKDALYGAAMGFLLAGFLGNLVFVCRDTLLPPENKFGSAVVAQTRQAQAYVCLSENAFHVHQVAAYYNPDVPIYTPETLGDASPYPNVHSMEDFSSQDYDTVLVFADEGVRPAEGFPRGYQSNLLGTYRDMNNTFDLWLLEKPQKPEEPEAPEEEVQEEAPEPQEETTPPAQDTAPAQESTAPEE